VTGTVLGNTVLTYDHEPARNYRSPPGEFSQPDYSVVYKDPDGMERTVGRIFRNHGLVGGERPWFWGVEFFQRGGRTEPHQGQVDTLEEGESGVAQLLGFSRRADSLAAVAGASLDFSVSVLVSCCVPMRAM
jgi:hypothetical protein